MSDSSTFAGGGNGFHDDVYLRDRVLGTTSWVSEAFGGGEMASGWCSTTSISGDGRWVAFDSTASDLVPDDTNGVEDVFLYDAVHDTTEVVSITSGGALASGGRSTLPVISANGRFLVFLSAAALVPEDTNGKMDVYVRDLTPGTVERANVSSSEAQADGETGNAPSISSDGRFVAFQSGATNLVSDDTNGLSDVFVRDGLAGTTERVTVDSDDGQANAGSSNASVSDDGRYVLFESNASNLVDGNPTSQDVRIRIRW